MAQGSRAPCPPDPLRFGAQSLFAFLLVSYPWTAPWVQQRFLGGIPLVLVYLFGVWAALIGLAAASRAEG